MELENSAVDLTNGEVPHKAADNIDKEAENKDKKPTEENTKKTPGKALIEFLEKNRSPLSAVYMKNKDLLVEILEAEKYKQLKALREKEQKELKEKNRKDEEEKKAAEKQQQELKAKEGQNTTENHEDNTEDESRGSVDYSTPCESDNEESGKNEVKQEYAEERMSLNQAMMIAITTSQSDMLDILLQAGADANAFDKWYPVIHTIVDMRNIDLFRITKMYVTDIRVESYYGNLLHASARSGSLELVKEIYGIGVTSLSKCKANGATPLHNAVRCVPSVCEECEKKIDTKEVMNDKNEGVKNGDESKGQAENETDSKAELSHKNCKEKYDFSIVQFFLDQGCPVDSQDSNLKTPLHEAAIIGNRDLVAVLLKAGANMMAVDSETNTPWLYCAIYYHCDLFEILIDVNAIDQPFDKTNNRYIHKVAQLGKVDALRFLLKKGANALVINDENMTPLKLAVHNNQVDCVKELLNQPDPGLNSVNATDTFLSALWRFSTYEKDVLELFLEKGQEIDAIHNGRTPLLINIHKENALEWLLKHGANPDIVTASGEYAFLTVCESGHGDEEEILKLLLHHNADIRMTDLCNSEGLSPLQLSIVAIDYNLARLCLVAGFSLCKIHDWLQMEEEKIKTIINEDPSFVEIFEYIKQQDYSPVSLKGLARLNVLKCLGCIGIEEKVKQLGLPVILEDFLNWDKYLVLRNDEFNQFVAVLTKKKT